ncbi:MAG: TVP38/TMEM64 family protein [Verrucomicrobiota bacterium]|nr:TVP38/TMEM64 family protein [Verrucomicrobiota bacterium]
MSNVKRAFYLQLIGLVLASLFAGWVVWTFPVVDYLTRAQRTIGELEFWGGILYPLLYAACNVLLLPGGVLAIGSGLFFGLWWGFLINLTGNVAGAAVAIFLGRNLGRQWLEQRIFRDRKWAALDELIAREGWKIIFLSQVHPLLPTSLLNYLYGITRIRLRSCLLWIALGQAPGLFLYAYLGTLVQFSLRIWQGKSDPLIGEYVIWISGLVLTLGVTIALARLALRLLAEAERAARRPVGTGEPERAFADAEV